ncbi:hypothetical protein SISSUDRAFT_1061594 [Sistotremastrum suecicum HHB10207 ss-3]|uniref:Uncharacterized protein n=1 Tax=Sistotremastrum suecicum HHB10207 ss-3 TaxID=1314776 RepID=A0A166DTG6_9AGAM|nr:hypothetical protein SISSUDRAFT_1061594 [Sistotremastrum suecicum HHB10207 ss-3]
MTTTSEHERVLPSYSSYPTTHQRLYLVPSGSSSDSASTTRYVFTPRPAPGTETTPTTPKRCHRKPRLSTYAIEHHRTAPSSIEPPTPLIPFPSFALFSTPREPIPPLRTYHAGFMPEPTAGSRTSSNRRHRTKGKTTESNALDTGPPLALAQIEGAFAQTFAEPQNF